MRKGNDLPQNCGKVMKIEAENAVLAQKSASISDFELWDVSNIPRLRFAGFLEVPVNDLCGGDRAGTKDVPTLMG